MIGIILGTLLAVLGFASIITLLLSPVDTENKRIDTAECIYYRKKTIIIWVIELCIAITCMIINFKKGTECIVFALSILAIALVGGDLQNKSQRKLIKERKAKL